MAGFKREASSSRRAGLAPKLGPVPDEEVEIVATAIYEQMSAAEMTSNKVEIIALLIHRFMCLTGEPWICGSRNISIWKVYLLETYAEHTIPASREAVWTSIPAICASFVRTFNTERKSGRPMPHAYPLDDTRLRMPA